MEITWLGHSCFKIKGKNGVVITDPFDPACGYKAIKSTADIVTVSHDHPGHNFTSGIEGSPRIITGPGEYEIGGIFVYGVRTFHDAKKGEKRGKNTTYLIEVDDVKVCHLGDLGHVLTSAQADDISDADVLLVPVGGGNTLDAAAAIEVVNLLSPLFVIPMHYRTAVSKGGLETPDGFLKEMGIKEVNAVPRLVINKSTMPIDMQTVVMDYNQ